MAQDIDCSRLRVPGVRVCSRALIAGGFWLGIGFSVAASAQEGASPGYGPDNLTFETWCHDIKGLDPARCSKRDAADLAAYQISLDRMQAFESEHQKELRKDREFREQFKSHEENEPYKKLTY